MPASDDRAGPGLREQKRGLRERKRGLRERKKARTRAEIQTAALRLFRRQGYDVTTVSQIAEAAEISRITFFRYFPGKADVVLDDLFDTTFVEIYRAQPPGLTPVQAMRSALEATFFEAPDERRDLTHDRDLLLHTVPELRAALQQRIAGKLELLTDLVAERARRPRTDVDVLTVAGAMIGVGQAAWIGAENGPPDGFLRRYHALLDAALARLEAGLPRLAEDPRPPEAPDAVGPLTRRAHHESPTRTAGEVRDQRLR